MILGKLRKKSATRDLPIIMMTAKEQSMIKYSDLIVGQMIILQNHSE